MSKHTAGPWKFYQPRNACPAVYGPEGDCLAICNGIETPNIANAHLIAAAPEMYEALKETMLLLRVLKDRNYDLWQQVIDAHSGTKSPSLAVDVWDANMAAIAKAEGK